LGYETVQRPFYSPDISPTDYHLFKHFRHFIKEKAFRNERDVKQAFVDFVDFKPRNIFRNSTNKLAEH
ncbi:Histone-lysine N-methyltransferase SETMAR, partial [Habropoda laboriosa]